MSETPKRIQRKRTRGWRMPENAVYVGRPTKWGNPNDFREWHDAVPRNVFWTLAEAEDWCRDRATQAFEEDLIEGTASISVEEIKRELAGKDLVCWCPPHSPCHADVLLELANGTPPR